MLDVDSRAVILSIIREIREPIPYDFDYALRALKPFDETIFTDIEEKEPAKPEPKHKNLCKRDLEAFEFIKKHPECKVSEIEIAIGITQNYVVSIAARLQRFDMIVRSNPKTGNQRARYKATGKEDS